MFVANYFLTEDVMNLVFASRECLINQNRKLFQIIQNVSKLKKSKKEMQYLQSMLLKDQEAKKFWRSLITKTELLKFYLLIMVLFMVCDLFIQKMYLKQSGLLQKTRDDRYVYRNAMDKASSQHDFKY